ncbi:hypothetical protein BDN71DRAFT_1431296 [Pleurotus eryngii]|uniref:Uncharacterized protein n=1 Tax=Pleurotus eryngii TaxID=5323 RepID=A0A9P5ZWK7_PLEER|nr:hypothetical protein BDN71DRAFT_1431296 [Pleurotus eryngii]
MTNGRGYNCLKAAHSDIASYAGGDPKNNLLGDNVHLVTSWRSVRFQRRHLRSSGEVLRWSRPSAVHLLPTSLTRGDPSQRGPGSCFFCGDKLSSVHFRFPAIFSKLLSRQDILQGLLPSAHPRISFYLHKCLLGIFHDAALLVATCRRRRDALLCIVLELKVSLHPLEMPSDLGQTKRSGPGPYDKHHSRSDVFASGDGREDP